MKDYTCYHISNKPEMFPTLQECMQPQEVNFHDGTNAGCFSRLVNTCVEKCSTETVVMMSDKVRPTISHLHMLLSLLDEGYAFVGLYRFAFFGFKKELFRRIGPLDEGYIPGGYEDDDYYIRIKEANLSMYLSHDVPYFMTKSTWYKDLILQQSYFRKKWGKQVLPDYKKAFRQFSEPSHNYNFGPTIDTNFLTWEHTKVIPIKIHKYLHVKIG